jgi:pimeloyl-ACP methyl ester carboxylesterase
MMMHKITADNSSEITFDSDGDTIHGWFYRSEGEGFSPTVILLHGYPGRDRLVFELGDSLTKKGVNALTFSVSGTWQSEGIFTPESSLENVKSAIDFLKLQQTIERLAIDTAEISLIGYSYGGGMALLGSLYDESVRKVCSIGGGDLSVVARMIEKNPDFRKSHQEFLDECMADPTVSRGMGGKASHEWLLEQKDEYDLQKFADTLAKKDILLLGGWRDDTIMVEDHILPLYRSLQKNGAESLKIHIFDTDHSFDNVKTELFSKIITWLKS